MQVLLFSVTLSITIAIVGWERRKLTHILIAYVSLVVSLMIAEAALRRATLPPPGNDKLIRFDEALGWRFVPNAEEVVECSDYCHWVKINSEGWRDKQHESSDRGAAPLVAVLGDSFVSNLGVHDSEVFTRIMDTQFGPDVTVRNFGVNGFGQVQELLLLGQILDSYRPTVVVVFVYVRNDFDDNHGQFDWNRGLHRPQVRETANGGLEIIKPTKPAPMPTPTSIQRIHRAIKGTALHCAVRRVFIERMLEDVPIHEQPPEHRYCKEEIGQLEKRALEITGLLVRQMGEKCEEKGVQFGVVVAPTLWQVRHDQWQRLIRSSEVNPAEYDRRKPQDVLMKVCSDAEIPCLDLLPILESCADKDMTLYHDAEQHWNTEGNRHVARAVASWLQQHEFLVRPHE